MARVPRIVVPGFPHHITQRGNRQAEVFFTPRDRSVYLALLRKYADRYGLSVYAYSLMTNHVHLVAVPSTEAALACALRDAHAAYASYVNRTQGVSGHLWQGRFFSCVLDEAHLWAAVRYVERNAARAGMVTHAADYPWSSAQAHLARTRPHPVLSAAFPPPGVIADWAAWLGDEESAAIAYLRRQTHTGRPCGSDSFLTALEELLQRRLRPLSRGPKPKRLIRGQTTYLPAAATAPDGGEVGDE